MLILSQGLFGFSYGPGSVEADKKPGQWSQTDHRDIPQCVAPGSAIKMGELAGTRLGISQWVVSNCGVPHLCCVCFYFSLPY